MTETGAGTIISNFNDPVSGHIGGPLANVKVKLKDIPEMGYFASEGNVAANKPPQGELCMKGSSIMEGYFRDPKNTADAFTEDGWLKSGDVA